MTTKHDTPDVWSDEAQAMRPRWELCRDVRGGTEVMRAKKSTYLPKFEAEAEKDWLTRVELTFAYDAFGLTIDTLTGLALTTEPELGEDVPVRIREEWEDIDGEGTHGSIFALQALDSALNDGHAGILTDFPPAEEGLTLAEEQSRGLRAYMVRVTIDQLPSWRWMIYGGRRILAQIVIASIAEEPDGAFGSKKVPEFRVYRQEFDQDGKPYVTWEKWRTGEKETTRVEGPTPIRGPKFIPFAPHFGGQRTGFLTSIPPLLGLAHSNVQHTQLSSDQAMLMHKCAVPIYVITGVNNPSDLKVGNAVWTIPKDTSAEVLEITGASLEVRRTAMVDLERRMADQGVAMLQRDTSAPRTATEVEFSRTRQESKLARAVRSLQDALEASFGFMAEYYGETKGGGSITIRRDFAALTLSDTDMELLTSMRERGDLTHETFLKLVRTRGGVFEQIEPEEEVEAVREEMGDDLEDEEEELEQPVIGAPGQVRGVAAS